MNPQSDIPSADSLTRILGIDYGTRRFGFAISDEVGIIATPLCVVEVEGDSDAVSAVKRLCDEQGAGRIVIGLPINMDGSIGPAAKAVEAFVELLAKEIGIPIDTWDERLTTSLVERMLIDADMSRAKRKGVRDKLAAQAILQSYLDSGQ